MIVIIVIVGNDGVTSEQLFTVHCKMTIWQKSDAKLSEVRTHRSCVTSDLDTFTVYNFTV